MERVKYPEACRLHRSRAKLPLRKKKESKITRNSNGPKRSIVLERLMYESDRKAPIKANPLVAPTKLVRARSVSSESCPGFVPAWIGCQIYISFKQ